MPRIVRYVLFELTAVFLLALTVMTLFVLLVGVGQEAVQQSLGLRPLLQLVPYVLPDALRFAVPGTILFAACVVYGRLAAANEIVALKAAGVAPMAVIWPGYALALVVSLVAVWLNDVAVTWGKQGVQRVVVQSVEQIVYGMLRTQKSYSTRRFSINVREVEGQKLLQPVLTFSASEDSPAVVLQAREAELRADLTTNELTILLTDGTIEMGDRMSITFPDTIQRAIPLSEATRKGAAASNPSQCPLRELAAATARQKDEVRKIEQSLAAEAAFQMLLGDFDALTDRAWIERRRQLRDAEYRLHRLRTEPWRRWASGFSCLFFVMVGIPWSIRMKSGDYLSSFFACFLPILLLYYPLLALGLDRAKVGALPPYAVWAGNVLLLLAGLWLMRGVRRY